MGIFLNSTAPFEAYKITALDKYFVDKTMLIEELIPSIGREQRFLCITRPRRFGKTVMANMVASYFGKAIDSSFVFEHLAIAKSPVYEDNHKSSPISGNRMDTGRNHSLLHAPWSFYLLNKEIRQP